MSSTFDLCLFAKQRTFPAPPGIEVNGKGGLVDTPASQSDTVESKKLHPLNNRKQKQGGSQALKHTTAAHNKHWAAWLALCM